MTLYLLHNFDFQYGNFASFVQLGATAFFIVIVVVNVKVCDYSLFASTTPLITYLW